VSIEDDYRAIVGRLRSWGFDIREESGCYGRSNGSGWSAGRPVGHVNHHYVCSMDSAQSYIDGLVANLVNGSTVQWFADVNGRGYLIGTGPMNHAGTGNQSVLDRTKRDEAPPSNPASSAGSISGNSHYSGTECQHPGDSTPWPAPMLDVMVAINAATFLQFGYSENRAINHSEWSNRKIDMSAGGGINSGGWSAAELRRRVAARMSGGSGSPGEWDEMATKDEIAAVVREQIFDPAFLEAVAVNVWTKILSDRNGADLLNSAAKDAKLAADRAGDLPVNVWLQPITDDTETGRANHLLAKAANG
jgi:hypothetical protein